MANWSCAQEMQLEQGDGVTQSIQGNVLFIYFFVRWQPSFNFTLPDIMGKEKVNKTKQQTNIF